MGGGTSQMETPFKKKNDKDLSNHSKNDHHSMPVIPQVNANNNSTSVRGKEEPKRKDPLPSVRNNNQDKNNNESSIKKSSEKENIRASGGKKGRVSNNFITQSIPEDHSPDLHLPTNNVNNNGNNNGNAGNDNGGNKYMSPAVFKLIKDSLSGFHIFNSQNIEFAIRSFDREEYSDSHKLIVKGESGDRLFVVESGLLEVRVSEEVTRTMGPGSTIGELSLLYDAPRSADVTCITKSIVWSLKRDVFKKVQALAASEAYLRRAKWLIRCPEFAVLPSLDLSRLVGNLKLKTFEAGEYLYKEGELTNVCILIEKGKANLFTQRTPPLPRNDPNYDEEVNYDCFLLRDNNSENSVNSKLVDKKDPDNGYFLTELKDGCFLGLGILRGKANICGAWKWIDSASGKQSKSSLMDSGHAISTISVIATETIEALTFKVGVFESMFGTIDEVVESDSDTLFTHHKHIDSEEVVIIPKVFSPSNFKKSYVLGSGTYGVVTLAEFIPTDEIPSVSGVENDLFAIKTMCKSDIVDMAQVRHVIDEVKTLKLMSSMFIMKLYGTYQTPAELMMVTEIVDCGDLWSVIYESDLYKEGEGLPISLVQFYTASIISAIAHIHDKGVVYRDLKPENILLDRKGYIRLIDFGFAKTVPYKKVDIHGNEKIHVKTYTLCGTPEYLSPEMIFNLGHDQSTDVWSLGVMVFEMIMCTTPFAPKRPDNMTELFTNIAIVKKNGISLPIELEVRCGSSGVVDLLTQMLTPEPRERIGIISQSTWAILQHKFFKNVDMTLLSSGVMIPEFIPKAKLYNEHASNLTPVRNYKGDQKLFEGFTQF